MGWLKNPTGVCGYILGVRDFVHTNNELNLCFDSGKYISVDFIIISSVLCTPVSCEIFSKSAHLVCLFSLVIHMPTFFNDVLIKMGVVLQEQCAYKSRCIVMTLKYVFKALFIFHLPEVPTQRGTGYRNFTVDLGRAPEFCIWFGTLRQMEIEWSLTTLEICVTNIYDTTTTHLLK